MNILERNDITLYYGYTISGGRKTRSKYCLPDFHNEKIGITVPQTTGDQIGEVYQAVSHLFYTTGIIRRILELSEKLKYTVEQRQENLEKITDLLHQVTQEHRETYLKLQELLKDDLPKDPELQKEKLQETLGSNNPICRLHEDLNRLSERREEAQKKFNQALELQTLCKKWRGILHEKIFQERQVFYDPDIDPELAKNNPIQEKDILEANSGTVWDPYYMEE